MMKIERKGLAYCWSVAIVANPLAGKARFEAWLADPDPDLRWMLRENLKKARLSRMDPDWFAACKAELEDRS